LGEPPPSPGTGSPGPGAGLMPGLSNLRRPASALLRSINHSGKSQIDSGSGFPRKSAKPPSPVQIRTAPPTFNQLTSMAIRALGLTCRFCLHYDRRVVPVPGPHSRLVSDQRGGGEPGDSSALRDYPLPIRAIVRGSVWAIKTLSSPHGRNRRRAWYGLST
jgi:hypothetical protein